MGSARPGTSLVLAIVTAGALSAGCGGGDDIDPDTVTREDFLGGTCLVLFADITTLRTFVLTKITQGPQTQSIDAVDLDTLNKAAERLRAGIPRAGGALRSPLEEVVAALDGLSAGGDDGSASLREIVDATEDVIAACT